MDRGSEGVGGLPSLTISLVWYGGLGPAGFVARAGQGVVVVVVVVVSGGADDSGGVHLLFGDSKQNEYGNPSWYCRWGREEVREGVQWSVPQTSADGEAKRGEARRSEPRRGEARRGEAVVRPECNQCVIHHGRLLVTQLVFPITERAQSS
ncbi:hypothetical protein E2C01_053819 [Portunus trituberculatus]|uniref:Uncharacterized protein n=1 Tax=Portunus trituberculatus TaxID=210409 RepID=A0A5B7GI85_PORTR|nr:hypothetical protein [Portunus trituberculatus]